MYVDAWLGLEEYLESACSDDPDTSDDGWMELEVALQKHAPGSDAYALVRQLRSQCQVALGTLRKLEKLRNVLCKDPVEYIEYVRNWKA
jgi:hypothetical protein